jgi:hypothetical protein
VPGKSATTEAVEEKPGPIQPIKLYDSKERKTYVAQTSITGKKGLPLSVSLHGSQAQGGPAGEWGDYYLYFGTPAMGYRDGIPGVFTVQENRGKEGNSLLLRPRDAIEHPSGRGAFETMWLGYYCIPQGAAHDEPRYYRFTENRLMWMIDWSIMRYGADPQRVSMGGQLDGPPRLDQRRIPPSGAVCCSLSEHRPLRVVAAQFAARTPKARHQGHDGRWHD